MVQLLLRRLIGSHLFSGVYFEWRGRLSRKIIFDAQNSHPCQLACTSSEAYSIVKVINRSKVGLSRPGQSPLLDSITEA